VFFVCHKGKHLSKPLSYVAGNKLITSFHEMKGTIGSLVFIWSGLEKSLRISIQKLHAGEIPKSSYGISRSLDAWQQAVTPRDNNRPLQTVLSNRLVEMLKEALVIRNLVCHGLIGIKAQFHAEEPEANLTVELGDDKRALTWSQLQELFDWMSRASWLIDDLTKAAMDNNDERSNARLRGWERFPNQKAAKPSATACATSV
jgi:hypothetical protein